MINYLLESDSVDSDDQTILERSRLNEANGFGCSSTFTPKQKTKKKASFRNNYENVLWQDEVSTRWINRRQHAGTWETPQNRTGQNDN